MTDQLVLVTGASGYIAMHCVLQLLEQGYRVRGTLRTLSRGDELRKVFSQHLDVGDRLEFAPADLLSDAGWDEAARGCDYVLHVASPLPYTEPKDESVVIKPAVEGTKRVLKAAAKAGVKRVVLTSSDSAIRAGHTDLDRPLDERDWSDEQMIVGAYDKSKTLAERAAWDFVAENGSPELAAINPGMVIGPLLNAHFSISIETVRKVMQRAYPGCPRLGWMFVDVRDVAAAHIAAMTTPEAAGLRFCCVHEFAWLLDIARILDREFASQGYRIPTRGLPDFVFRIAAVFDQTVRMTLPLLGQRIEYSSKQIKRVLGWQPWPLEETVIATARSLIEFDLI